MAEMSLKDVELFHKCCQAIVDHKEEESLNWCVNYAKAGLKMVSGLYIKTQIPYILNNMTNWRGVIARQTRDDLKSLI